MYRYNWINNTVCWFFPQSWAFFSFELLMIHETVWIVTGLHPRRRFQQHLMTVSQQQSILSAMPESSMLTLAEWLWLVGDLYWLRHVYDIKIDLLPVMTCARMHFLHIDHIHGNVICSLLLQSTSSEPWWLFEGLEGKLSELFRAMLCTTVVHNDTHTHTHTHEQFCWFRLRFSFCVCFRLAFCVFFWFSFCFVLVLFALFGTETVQVTPLRRTLASSP